MNAAPANPAAAARVPADAIDMKLEVLVVPVADVDRAKRFYGDMGWRLDADFAAGADWRVVQMTPPGSPCSVLFGKGLTAAAPGSLQGPFLVVDDVEAARAELVAKGVEASEVFHFTGGLHVSGTEGRVAGPDPQRRSYSSWLSFRDPDGNGWMVQEVRQRLPGRGGLGLDVATLTDLLKEAETQHGSYEPTAAKHHWSSYYAAYIVGRERGKDVELAARDAAQQTDAASR